MGRKNDSLPRGLSRVDHPKSDVHVWRVQKSDGTFLYFGDAKFGGKDGALRAALEQLKNLPIIGVKSSKSATNTTGTIGVCPVRYKGEIVAFKAISGSGKGQKVHVFSLCNYGENIAYRLAVLARMDFIRMAEEQELAKRNRQIKEMLTRLENHG